ncbi:MAG: DUF2271 domain-containing protein, partial [Planctomycetota bacterium]
MNRILTLVALLVIPTLVTGEDATTKTDLAPSLTSDQPGLHVWFKLERPAGARYRRPYLAVWLEDPDGYPVKTATLWWQTEQPGPRWHRDLT